MSPPDDQRRVVFAGPASNLGSAGQFRLETDRAGKFCVLIDGPLAYGAGADGETAWAMDASGIARTVHQHERARELLTWWSWSGFVLDSAFPGSRTILESETTKQRTYELALDGVRARLTTTAHGRPVSLLFPDPIAGDELTLFEGDATVHGLTVPRRTRTTRAGLTTRTLQVSDVKVLGGEVDCAPPPPPVTTLAARRDNAIEVRRAPTGHLLVRPVIDGEILGWFILDTGGGPGVLSSAAVRKIDSTPVGTGLATTVTGTVSTSWHKAAMIELGPVRMHDVALIELDLEYLTEPLGTPIAGILGYGFFARVIVEVASDSRTLRVLPPDDPRLEQARWNSLTLVDLVPVVDAAFSGGVGRFRLDLGAGGGAGGVVFHSPAVRRLGLDTLHASRATASSPQAMVTTLDWLELGGRRIPDVPTLLWRSAQGALADPHLTGNIGLTVLDRFSLLLDYSRGRFALVPLAP